MLFLGERLRRWQAFHRPGGVVCCVAHGGLCLRMALSPALSFGLYGLLRKVSPLGSLGGLSQKTAALSIPAIAYLIYREGTGGGHRARRDRHHAAPGRQRVVPPAGASVCPYGLG